MAWTDEARAAALAKRKAAQQKKRLAAAKALYTKERKSNQAKAQIRSVDDARFTTPGDRGGTYSAAAHSRSKELGRKADRQLENLLTAAKAVTAPGKDLERARDAKGKYALASDVMTSKITKMLGTTSSAETRKNLTSAAVNLVERAVKTRRGLKVEEYQAVKNLVDLARPMPVTKSRKAAPDPVQKKASASTPYDRSKPFDDLESDF